MMFYFISVFKDLEQLVMLRVSFSYHREGEPGAPPKNPRVDTVHDDSAVLLLLMFDIPDKDLLKLDELIWVVGRRVVPLQELCDVDGVSNPEGGFLIRCRYN